ncbi:hypothetical protein ABW02_23280 [Niallia circulans]|uniref:Uncharacterized protein n=1 Tax=Niallia circulans TaxID=1397 RepID=A0A0J1KVB3_NIACI|nr:MULTISPECIES: hypothetical protein [Bacillaceae]KAB7665685.1 hypothetical protein F9279_19595 [Bacillus sp. B1-b2]KLV20655.1 hypothetical protein ABW02_23280 [Niallia circulans]MCF2649956.1 hypothetical protein [Niallia circulans]CAI9394883.1 hypothetical protein BACSP_03940 [Bacillus sp. T2.9-1]
MENAFRIKLGGVMSIIAGFSLATAHSINLLFSNGEGIVIGKAIVFIAHLLIVFAFFGFHESQRDKNGIFGSIGMVLGVIGTIIVTAIVFVEMAGVSNVKIDEIFAVSTNHFIYSFGPLLFVLGMIFVGISMVRAKLFPSAVGLLLILGTIVFALGTVAGNLEPLISTTGAIITGLGFIWGGLFLFRRNSM